MTQGRGSAHEIQRAAGPSGTARRRGVRQAKAMLAEERRLPNKRNRREGEFVHSNRSPVGCVKAVPSVTRITTPGSIDHGRRPSAA